MPKRVYATIETLRVRRKEVICYYLEHGMKETGNYFCASSEVLRQFFYEEGKKRNRPRKVECPTRGLGGAMARVNARKRRTEMLEDALLHTKGQCLNYVLKIAESRD